MHKSRYKFCEKRNKCDVTIISTITIKTTTTNKKIIKKKKNTHTHTHTLAEGIGEKGGNEVK